MLGTVLSVSSWYKKLGIFTRGQFWISGIVVACDSVSLCVFMCVCQPRACLQENLSPVQARTTKFKQKMQKTFVKIPINLGDDYPWPSMSNLTKKSKFYNAQYVHQDEYTTARVNT